MKRLFLLILLFISLLALPVFADEGDKLVFTTEQTEYYFLLGQNAVIGLNVTNDYEQDIQGMLRFSNTQKVTQGNSIISQSNSQSASTLIKAVPDPMFFDLGTSDSPSEITISWSFDYTWEDEGIEVILPPIKVFFVEDEQQQQNQQNQQESESKTDSEKREEQKQQEKKQQEQLEEQMKQQETQNQLQNKLQNNQMNQNTNALKQQMQKEVAAKQQMENEFRENLAKNPDFQKEHQEMLNQGYNLSNDNLDLESNNTGDFQINYKKGDETAQIEGRMENNELKDINSKSPKKNEDALSQLRQDPRFQELNEQLQNEGFEAKTPKFNQDKNNTEIKIEYKNQENKTAIITAKLENNKVKEVKLKKERERSWLWYLLGLPLILAAILTYRRKTNIQFEVESIEQEKPLDHKTESLALLSKAKSLFEKQEFKDAYATVSEALRFYYIHQLKIKTEITNTELVKYLRKNKKKLAQPTNSCLNICAMVEFAKYQPNQEDFSEAWDIANKLIR